MNLKDVRVFLGVSNFYRRFLLLGGLTAFPLF
jgi:hypothetical protein